MMKKRYEFALVFLLGGAVYTGLETLVRGFSHWTMFFAGGLSFLVLYKTFTFNNRSSLLLNCLYGGLVITGIEFLFGFFFNIILGWRVWDYSHYPMHFLGQVCLPFTLLWFLLSAPVYWFSKSLRDKVFI
jgi:uncharacterized membrane protein